MNRRVPHTSLSKILVTLSHGQKHIQALATRQSWENQSGGHGGGGDGWGSPLRPYHPQLLDLESADV